MPHGSFEAFLFGWSGFVDPDHNIYSILHCTGSLNYGRYCNSEVDRLLDAARASSDVDERVRLYTQMNEILSRDEPYIFLYHRRWLWGHTVKLKNFVPYPDGMIRVLDLKLN